LGRGVSVVRTGRPIKKVESRETRTYIPSKSFNFNEFTNSAQNRCGRENSLRWISDVAFREDECQVHAGYAAENFSVPQHIAPDLLKQGTRIKRGIKTGRKVARWDENYLPELLKGNFRA
jgi:predicted transposase YbfD/YdcC